MKLTGFVGMKVWTSVTMNDGMKPGYKVKLTLNSAKGKEPFYEKFGFRVRPNDDAGAGMDQWLIMEDADPFPRDLSEKEMERENVVKAAWQEKLSSEACDVFPADGENHQRASEGKVSKG